MSDEISDESSTADQGGGDELDQLRAIARRVDAEPVAWQVPPSGLWERVSSDLAASSGIAPAAGGGAESGDAPADPATRPRSRGSVGRLRSPLPWLAAAAAVVVVVAGALSWSLRSDDPAVVARVELELLGEAGEGTATLTERDGTFHLRLATGNLDVGDDTFVEVWIINPEVTEMYSLGPLRRDGRYELPAGIDPAAFPIVDISIEPFDGDPTHSGNSVLRGRLEF